MGYTNYWKIKEKLSESDWNKLSWDVALLMRDTDIVIQFESDDPRPPIIDNELIRFNGQYDDGHETFVLVNEVTDFECCKTDHKPYDMMVCAVLALTAEYGVIVTSDGKREDWADALKFASGVLNRKVVCPVKEAK